MACHSTTRWGIAQREGPWPIFFGAPAGLLVVYCLSQTQPNCSCSCSYKPACLMTGRCFKFRGRANHCVYAPYSLPVPVHRAMASQSARFRSGIVYPDSLLLRCTATGTGQFGRYAAAAVQIADSRAYALGTRDRPVVTRGHRPQTTGVQVAPNKSRLCLAAPQLLFRMPPLYTFSPTAVGQSVDPQGRRGA
jgi:hypothetical protein